MALIGVFSPDSEPELAVVVAMLRAHEIPCFVHGRYFSSVWPGVQINACNTQTVMVPEEHVHDAAELIQDFRGSAPAASSTILMTWRDKLRIVLEGFVLGWFVPGTTSLEDES